MNELGNSSLLYLTGTSSTLPRAKTLLVQSWQDFQSRWQLYVALTAVAIAPGAFLSSMMIGGMIFEKPYLFGIGFLLSLPFSVLDGFLQYLSSVALVLVAGDQERSYSFWSAYRQALRFFISTAWVGVLASLVILFGLFLLVIPGIIALVALSLVTFVVIFEGKRGMAALRASYDYTRGLFWPLTSRFLVAGIIGGAIWLPSVFLYFGKLVAPSHLVFTIIYGIVVGLITWPLFTIYAYRIYRSVREVKNISPPPSL